MKRRCILMRSALVALLFISLVNFLLWSNITLAAEVKSGWSSLGSGVSGGSVPITREEVLDGSIDALAIGPDGMLYASGSFSKAGGVKANNIAKWNGSSWSALGNGLDGPANALVVAPNGTLYAANLLDGAISKWNGSRWSALPKVGLSQVLALAVAKDGTLYAAGEPNQNSLARNKSNVRCVWKWNGTGWAPLGSGMAHSGHGLITKVFALAVAPDGGLYAGGSFTRAGNVMTSGIAKWNGSAWSALGGGIDARGSVRALTVASDGTLYAGGDFKLAGGVRANGIAKWNGYSWSALGPGLGANAGVYGLAVTPKGVVYAGGFMQKHFITKWNGAKWTAMGSGVDYNVNAIVLGLDGTLYVGGWFEKAGGRKVKYIAQWKESK